MGRLYFIKWFGGKGMLLKFLKQYIPSHRFYAELFGGGAALLLNKKPVEREFYNDLDERLYKLFTAVKEDENFPAKADFLFHSRLLYSLHRDDPLPFWTYFISRTSFGGRFGSGWAIEFKLTLRNVVGVVSKSLTSFSSLPHIRRRLHNVEITNLDWRQWIEKYQPNTPDWFLYLDPPYLQSTRKAGGYEAEMSDSDHEELIDFCLRAKCKIMLSGYENPLYARLEQAGWRKVLKETACHAAGRIRGSNLRGKGSARKHQKRVECLWMNY